MLKRLKFTAAVFTLTFAAACAQTGLVAPGTFNENVAYGYSTLATVRVAAASALTSGVIGTTDAEQVQRLADEARLALDAARTVGAGGDLATAQAKLALANGVLTQLQQFLATHNVVLR